MTSLFFFATMLGAIFIVQPLIFALVVSEMTATVASTGPKVAKNVFTIKSMDHIVLGCAIGFFCGFALRKIMFVSKSSKKAVTVKGSKSKKNVSADLNALLA